jgi:polyhydroxyalkanoate synthesis repressor PhaR
MLRRFPRTTGADFQASPTREAAAKMVNAPRRWAHVLAMRRRTRNFAAPLAAPQKPGDRALAQSSGRPAEGEKPEPVVIKKYANRRLYNTDSSSYVTLDHLSEMVRDGVDFIVQDAKTGEDLTRSVLTQIIFEQENSGGQTLLPVQFLRRLIRFYGDQLQGFLPHYLNMSMESFAKGQEQMREQMARAFGGKTPMAAFEEQARQNMALFQQALSMWTPFAGAAAPAREGEEASKDDAVAELRKQMEAMQKQLDQISGSASRKP